MSETRWSNLAPLTIQEQENLAVRAAYFFNPLSNMEMRVKLNLPVKPNTAIPLSLMNFFTWYEQNTGEDPFKRQQRFCEFFNMLDSKNFLSNTGYGGRGALDRFYYFKLELTNIEKKGRLFLGKYLGIKFIANKISQNLAHITGKTNTNERHAGSGILITPQVILTCRHVLDDMQIDDHVTINGGEYKIKKHEVHPTIDFGVIVIDSPVTPPFCEDIALRNSTLLESIIIAGFPKIPGKLNDCPIIQSGEIAGRIESYLNNKAPLELFTAISRPGNSGGPVMSADGKLLGIVTQSLERKKENIDNRQSVMPCFAAIPANVIFAGFRDLNLSKTYSLPWEDYQ